jgi:DNA (cytosine-5)-methyltransferase 1
MDLMNKFPDLGARNKRRCEDCSPQSSPASARLRFFDAFSGIGGFKIALERVGFEGIGFCDNDKYANQLYLAFLANNNEVHYEDIRQIDTKTMPDFEIFCGGFPCQSFSIAGKRRGFEDTRGTLFFEVARILQDKKPKYFILENVKGLLNHNGGRTFATIIGVLSDLGYQVQWQVLNSKFFGVPQNRERVYIVGCLGDECIGKIFPLTGGDSENIGEIIKHPMCPKNAPQGSRIYSSDGIGSCLVANGGSGKTGLYCIKNGCDSTALLNASLFESSHTAHAINKPRFNKYKESDIVETLKVGGDTPLMKVRNGTKKGFDEAGPGDGINLAFPQSKTRRGRVGKQCSQTLDTHCNMGTIDDYRIRRLTPLECFRLQGFPDGMVQKARELGISDAQLYKMAGNAVTVNVAQAVAQKLWEAIYGT